MHIIVKSVSIAVICLQCLFVSSATSHPGHDHVLNEKQAIMRATAVVSSLVDKEKKVKGEMLDESWKQATDTAACKETPEYYLISFDNRQVGKTLYVLLTSAGKYLRANFDGQFADLIFSPYPVQSCG